MTPAPDPAPAAPKKKAAPPYDWKRDGSLTSSQGEAKCRAEKPDCKRAFANYVSPPHPCANRGARCMEPLEGDEGYWTCDCDECTSHAECGAGSHCGSNAQPCSAERQVMRCVSGPAPKPALCPAPSPEPKAQ